MKIKLGPAGLGGVKTALEVLEKYAGLGFGACEIAFVRQIYIKKDEDAQMIGDRARELGITLSIHAPYYINLNSADEKKIEASKNRILECCRVGELMGVKKVVFHPGYYLNGDREEVYQNIKVEVLDMLEKIREKGWKIELAPETMGKVNVFGSVDEISRLARETGCSYCIDFAHILAREKKVDFNKIKRLFPEKKWHCHFSGIVYGEKGEKHHKSTTREEWIKLFKNLPKDIEIVIINESPTMIEDCVEGLGILG